MDKRNKLKVYTIKVNIDKKILKDATIRHYQVDIINFSFAIKINFLIIDSTKKTYEKRDTFQKSSTPNYDTIGGSINEKNCDF